MSSSDSNDALKRRFIRWLEDNRGLILTVVGLPASFLFDVVMQASKKELRNLATTFLSACLSTCVTKLRICTYLGPPLVLPHPVQLPRQAPGSRERRPASSPPVGRKEDDVHLQAKLALPIHHVLRQGGVPQGKNGHSLANTCSFEKSAGKRISSSRVFADYS